MKKIDVLLIAAVILLSVSNWKQITDINKLEIKTAKHNVALVDHKKALIVLRENELLLAKRIVAEHPHKGFWAWLRGNK